MTVRVLLADDHTMLRESLRRSLEASGVGVLGEASDGVEAVRLAAELLPDVVLMDVSMPGLDGVEATRIIKRETPSVQVVMLTMHADQEVLVRALRAGAAGYLVKDCTTEDVVRTIHQAASGDASLTPEVAAAMLAEAHRPERPEPEAIAPLEIQSAGPEFRTVPARPADPIISKREEEVLQLIAEGASTTEVAERLYISVKTVKNHLASVYQKLDSRDRTQAVLRAVRMGIIRLD
jgi:two-component system, NarL family, response regulator DegU